MKTPNIMKNLDAASNQVSVELNLGDFKVYAIQVDFSSGTLSGTLKLQVKNEASIIWIDLPGSSQAVVAGASHYWNAGDAGYQQVRVDWVAGAGAGTMTAHAVIKENPIKGA